MKKAEPTIEEALAMFVSEPSRDTDSNSRQRTEAIMDLLTAYLDGVGASPRRTWSEALLGGTSSRSAMYTRPRDGALSPGSGVTQTQGPARRGAYGLPPPHQESSGQAVVNFGGGGSYPPRGHRSVSCSG